MSFGELTDGEWLVDRDPDNDCLTIYLERAAFSGIVRGPTGVVGFVGAPGRRGMAGRSTPGHTGPRGESGEYPVQVFRDALCGFSVTTNQGRRFWSEPYFQRVPGAPTGAAGPTGALIRQCVTVDNNLVLTRGDGTELFASLPALAADIVVVDDPVDLPDTAYPLYV